MWHNRHFSKSVSRLKSEGGCFKTIFFFARKCLNLNKQKVAEALEVKVGNFCIVMCVVPLKIFALNNQIKGGWDIVRGPDVAFYVMKTLRLKHHLLPTVRCCVSSKYGITRSLFSVLMHNRRDILPLRSADLHHEVRVLDIHRGPGQILSIISVISMIYMISIISIISIL